MLFSSTTLYISSPSPSPYTFPYTSCSLSKKEDPTSQLERENERDEEPEASSYELLLSKEQRHARRATPLDRGLTLGDL
jgi:hypothetical protein